MGDNTRLFFQIIATDKKVNFDYTPKWVHSSEPKFADYVDNVIFPKVLTNKKYEYRVVSVGSSSIDVTREAYGVEHDGSQKVNFLEYNSGYGFSGNTKIKVYAVDPSNGDQFLVAQWK